MSANPVLHWPLDSITRGNTVIDTTENHLNARLEGNPQSTPDEKFGSCVVFGGQTDAFVLEDSPPIRLRTYTVELWINPNQPSTWAGVIGKPGRNYCMFLHTNGYVHHRFATPANSNDGFNTPSGSIRWKVWQHVAITNDGHTARTYIDGKLSGEYSFTGDLVVSQQPLIVGRDLDGGKRYFYAGRMAHVRLYDAPLSALEIQHDMAEDEAALAAFVRAYPIDFNLYNQDQHHVLYIDDNPAGQVMTLQLTNTSRQDLVLPDIGQNVSAQDHHFALGFRPQTVAQTPQPSLAIEDGDWVFGRTPDNTSFYLLHKGEMRLPAGQSTGLTLRGMNADGRGGTRGTRVELLYQRLKYSGEEAELRGSRLQYLDVVNHRGLREIPLHAGFVGGNTVLSDGSTPSSPLRLRIANTSRDSKIRLNAGDATTPVSSFVVSFDVQEAKETREWALIDSANADGAQLKVSGGSGKWADPVKSNLGQSIEWTITPQENVELGPNDSLILTLDKVIALQSLGHANIYVNYRNIPGYQDGQFVVGVEKSPLLFWQKNITDAATIGVGLQQPTQTLDVNGNIRQRGFDFYLGLGDGGRGDTGHSRALVKDRGSRLTINYASDFKGGVNVRGPQISLDGNVAVGASETSAKMQVINQAQDADGNTLILGPINAAHLRLGYHTDYSWIQSHGAKPLALNPIGNNVGIGTAESPTARLEVESDGPQIAITNARKRNWGFFNWTDDKLYFQYGENGVLKNNAMVLDQNGALSVGAIGIGDPSYSFTRVIFGHTILGSHSGGVKKIAISFPQPFRRRPFVVVTARSENSDYTDTFACTVRYLDTARFEVNIMRLDSHGAGWNQQVRLHWMAWETTHDSDS